MNKKVIISLSILTLIGLVSLVVANTEEISYQDLALMYMRAEQKAIDYQNRYNALVNVSKDLISRSECYSHGSGSGTQPVQVPEPVETWTSGDSNEDGVCDADDYIVVKRNLGKSCSEPNWCSHTDFNKDGIVDSKDLVILSGCM